MEARPQLGNEAQGSLGLEEPGVPSGRCFWVSLEVISIVNIVEPKAFTVSFIPFKVIC